MKDDKYKVFSEQMNGSITHTCSMDYQTIKQGELKNLNELSKLYELIIDKHKGILNENHKIRGIESVLRINFEK